MAYIICECCVLLILLIMYSIIMYVVIDNLTDTKDFIIPNLSSNYLNNTSNNTILKSVDITELLESEFPRIYYLILNE